MTRKHRNNVGKVHARHSERLPNIALMPQGLAA
jgi:hypothetical protein